MKVLLITSFYSGLRQSVLSNHWQPQGMPAVYKLLEGFKAADIDFHSILIADETKAFESQKLSLDEFSNGSFQIICKTKEKSLLRLADEYTHFKALMRMIINSHKLNEYDLIYIDRANASLLPFLKETYKGKIVLRLHGIGTLYQNFQHSYKFRLLNWWKKNALATPIDLLISSRDGTPVPDFIKHYVHASTPTKVLLNGVDYFQNRPPSSRKISRFLFVGRLEEDKGIKEVVKAFVALTEDEKQKCQIDIVGDGLLKESIEKELIDEKHIIFHGQLSHKETIAFYSACDALISINYLGNISNVILEAIANENALITLAPDSDGKFDKETRSFLSDNALYIARDNVSPELTALVSQLLTTPSQLTQYQALVKQHLKPQLQSWADRVQKEIKMLQDLCEG